jgi:hypothetical protein
MISPESISTGVVLIAPFKVVHAYGEPVEERWAGGEIHARRHNGIKVGELYGREAEGLR